MAVNRKEAACVKKKTAGKLSRAMLFILLFAIVSLFSDMTHEGAASISGVFYRLLGASAATIGFISGLGELVGYSLRYFFGRLADRTRQYWPLVIIGYLLDIIAVPALALVGKNGFWAAAALLIVQRTGKAIKKPAKNTIMSFAATREGVGKSFGLQELLDQIGAFLGPVLLYLVMLGKTRGDTYLLYRRCFAFLAIPGALTLFFLFLTRRRFPDPEQFEPEAEAYVPFRLKKDFRLYVAGISLFAFGFVDYSLIIMHISATFTDLAGQLAETSRLVNSGTVPLLYAGAMLVDAAAAVVFGNWYDKRGIRVLAVSTALSAPMALLIFSSRSVGAVILGVALWGIGMGAQESILKAAVTTMVPKASRATGYGIFECFFGISSFLGTWLCGILYDHSLPAMIAVSVLAQAGAVVLYLLCDTRNRKEEK